MLLPGLGFIPVLVTAVEVVTDGPAVDATVELGRAGTPSFVALEVLALEVVSLEAVVLEVVWTEGGVGGGGHFLTDLVGTTDFLFFPDDSGDKALVVAPVFGDVWLIYMDGKEF